MVTPKVAAAVCDTHALLYHAGGDRRLGRRAAALFAACDARDALIVAAARVLDLPLVTCDREIAASSLVATLW